MAISENNKQFIVLIKDALEPLLAGLDSPEAFIGLVEQFGWDATIDPTQFAQIESAFNAILTIYDTLGDLVIDLENGVGDEMTVIQGIADSAKGIITAVQAFTGSPPSLAFMPFTTSGFWSEFPRQITDYMMIRLLQTKVGWLAGLFRLVGIFDIEKTTPTGTGRIPYTAYTLNWDKIPDLLTDPTGLIKETYEWDTANPFKWEKLFENVYSLLNLVRFPARFEEPSDTILDAYYSASNPMRGDVKALELPLVLEVAQNFASFAEAGIRFFPVTPTGNTNTDPNGIGLAPFAHGTLSTGTSSSVYSLGFEGGFDTNDFFRVDMRPDGLDYTLDMSVTDLHAKTIFTYAPLTPFVIIGVDGGHRVEIDKLVVSVGVRGPISDPEVMVSIGAGEEGKLRFIFQPKDGDGFINKMFGEDPLVLEFGGEITWSSKTGFGLNGNVGFDINIPINKNLGPLGFKNLNIGASAGSGSAPKINAGLGVSLKLGPFTAVVENIGASLALVEKTDGSGILGNMDIDWGFKPPTAIGLSLESDAIKGGGFLSFDYENERYVGMIELSIKDKIAVTAIGLLTTRMPDGSKGFSLLLLITAQFPPIQLGFGFTLNGVGGLIGVNRTMKLDVLRDGVRTGALESILFPENVVENANQIITDLRSIFPPEEGRFAFGPMGKLGWGTPALLDMEIGLLIELPSPVRLAILGIIRAILPDEEAALIKIQVAFLGTIDFEKKFITFDASLFDSKLLTFTLEGDMAVRIKWGDNSNFVFSVGGFHPSYTPPPLELPTMRRLTLNLINKSKLRLILTTYMAVTSNTVQFGAAVDFYAKVISKVTVKGFLRFDALFQFSPFYFIVTFEAGLAVYWKSKSVMSLYLSIMLEGPTPWHAKGRAEFKVMGIKCKLKFDETWGQNSNTSLPDVAVMPKLVEALSNKANWVAGPPAKEDKLVSLRDLDGLPPTNVVAHPDSVMSVSQKVVPLNTTISQFSNQKPSDYTWFDLKLEDENAVEFDDDDVKEEFAPASYFTLNNDQKLSRPSFEKYNGGLKVRGTDEFYSDYFREREVEFERVVMDSRYVPVYDTVCYAPKTSEFNAWVSNGSASKSALGSVKAMQSPLAPAKVNVSQAEFALVTNDELNIFEGRTAATLMEAQSILNEVLEERPELTYKLNVVPAYEIA